MLAAFVMFTLIALMAAEPEFSTRALYLIPIAIAFVGLLALLCVEYEAVGRAGWREYAEKRIRGAKAEMEMDRYLDDRGHVTPWDPHVPRFRASGKAQDRRMDFG
jgi:hypothetical protein